MSSTAECLGSEVPYVPAAAMKDPKAIAYEVAKQLHITTATLYTYVNPDGSLKNVGQKLHRASMANSSWYPQ